MKFKVGDKVKHKEYGFGKIIYIDEEARVMPYAVQFETFNEDLYDLGEFGAPKVKNGHGRWCEESDLELDKQQSHNLIPQIAKMLGVEIGEEFYIKGWSSFKHKFENGTLMSRTNGNLYEEAEYETWVYLIKGNYQDIVKLPKASLLTEDEKAILRNIPKQYKWIVRDNSGALYIYVDRPKKYSDGRTNYSLDCSNLFKHLFQFIKWEDEEPYSIEELLKGE